MHFDKKSIKDYGLAKVSVQFFTNSIIVNQAIVFHRQIK
jgi:hypothetical protein